MAQNFYTKWQDAILADAGDYVSKEYRSFQTALVREISKYAAAVGAKVASNSKGHYDTSCFIERNGKFVYISHSSGLSRMGSGVRIELDSFLIRTAQNGKDYRGGCNQYCDIANLQSMIDGLLGEINCKKDAEPTSSASFSFHPYRRIPLPYSASCSSARYSSSSFSFSFTVCRLASSPTLWS